MKCRKHPEWDVIDGKCGVCEAAEISRKMLAEHNKSPAPFGLLERFVKWPVVAMKWCVKILSICALVLFLVADGVINAIAERTEKILDWAIKDT